MIEYRIEEFPIFTRAGKVIGRSFATVLHAETDPDTDDLWIMRIALEDEAGDEVLVLNDYEAPGLYQHFETYAMKHYEDELRERIAEDRAGQRTDARIARMREAV